MCLGVPGLVIERETASDELSSGMVEFAGIRRRVCLALVPEAEAGDYVIVHAGIAISTVDPAEAERIFAHLKALGDADGWMEDAPATSASGKEP